MERMSRIQAIRGFFEGVDAITPLGGRKVETGELRALTAADREEIGTLCAKALGVELDVVPKN